MNYDQLIKDYRQELANSKEAIQQEYRSLGRGAWKDSNIAKLPDEQYSKILQSCNELDKEKTASIRSLKEAEQYREQMQDRRQSIDKKEQEKSKLESGLQELFEKVGAQIFDIYSVTPQQYIHYSSILPHLSDLFREKHKLEGRADNLVALNSQRSAGIIRKARQQVTKNKLRGIERKTASAFRKVGQQIGEKWRAKPGDDKRLAEIFSPVMDQYEKIAEIQRAIARYRKEIQGIQTRRQEFAGDSDPDRHLKSIHSRISELDEKLEEEFTKSGELLFQQLKDSPPEKLSGFFTSIEQLFGEKGQQEKLIRRFEAARQAKSLREEQKRVHQKKTKILQQIAALEGELQALVDTANSLEQEAVSQEKIRGNELELINSV